MSGTHFSIKFDGELLSGHEMDVKDFAPALIALGTVFEQANKVLNNGATTVNLKVTATKQGSFGIDLHLIQSLTSQIDAFVSGLSISDAASIQNLVFGSGGVVSLLLLWRVLIQATTLQQTNLQTSLRMCKTKSPPAGCR